MGKFSGTVTLITGASSGIGAALALEIAREGGDVALCARRRERLEEAAQKIAGMGRSSLPITCDVAREGDIEKALAEASDYFGKVDYVVANAGFGVAGPVEKLTMEDYRRQFETNVFGVIRTAQAARAYLVKTKGCLGIIGSVNGYLPLAGASAYCMSKAAVHSFANALRLEMKKQGVGVVLIVPGFVASELRKVDRKGVFRPEVRDYVPPWLQLPAEEAARRIAAALHRRKRMEVVTLHGKAAVFLKRHFPGLTYTVLSRFGKN